MPATYQCAACNATWSADREPGGCPQCGSRIVDRLRQSDAAFEDHYSPPKSSISTSPPVSSMAFSVTYWLGWAGLLLGFIIIGAATDKRDAGANAPTNDPLAIAGVLLLVASGSCLLAAYIVSLVKLYRGWDLIQPLRRIDRIEASMTTPGMAVGMLFVPFYNLYWNFVAIHGLAVRANKYMVRSGIDARPMGEGLAQTYCIMYVCSIIPCVGPLIGLASALVYYLFILDVDRMRGAIQAWRGDRSKINYIDEFEAI